MGNFEAENIEALRFDYGVQKKKTAAFKKPVAAISGKRCSSLYY